MPFFHIDNALPYFSFNTCFIIQLNMLKSALQTRIQVCVYMFMFNPYIYTQVTKTPLCKHVHVHTQLGIKQLNVYDITAKCV